MPAAFVEDGEDGEGVAEGRAEALRPARADLRGDDVELAAHAVRAAKEFAPALRDKDRPARVMEVAGKQPALFAAHVDKFAAQVDHGDGDVRAKVGIKEGDVLAKVDAAAQFAAAFDAIGRAEQAKERIARQKDRRTGGKDR